MCPQSGGFLPHCYGTIEAIILYVRRCIKRRLKYIMVDVRRKAASQNPSSVDSSVLAMWLTRNLWKSLKRKPISPATVSRFLTFDFSLIGASLTRVARMYDVQLHLLQCK